MDKGVDSLNAWRVRWLAQRKVELSTKVVRPTTTKVVSQKSTSTTPTPPHPGIVAELIKIMRRLFELELAHDSPGPIRRARVEQLLEDTRR